jgi:hypothetical protein
MLYEDLLQIEEGKLETCACWVIEHLLETLSLFSELEMAKVVVSQSKFSGQCWQLGSVLNQTLLTPGLLHSHIDAPQIPQCCTSLATKV